MKESLTAKDYFNKAIEFEKKGDFDNVYPIF